MPRFVLLAAVLAALGGCVSPREPPAPLENTCDEGTPAPVTVAELVRALRAKGFAVVSDPSWCLGGDVAAVANDEEEDAGVSCRLFRRRGIASATLDVVHYVTDQETYVSVLNLQCSLYPAHDEQRELSRLYAALERLVAAELRGGLAIRFRRPSGHPGCGPPSVADGSCSFGAAPLTYVGDVCMRVTRTFRGGNLVRVEQIEREC